MACAYIYLITNSLSGERYIGVTSKSVELRWLQHKQKAARDPTTKFYHSLSKNGPEIFEVTVLLTVLDAANASAMERVLIKEYKPEYNMTNGGEHTVGRRVTPDVAEKIRQANTGKKRTDESRLKMSLSRKNMFENNPEAKLKSIEYVRNAYSKIDQTKRLEAIRKCAAEGRMFNNRTPQQQEKFFAASQLPSTRLKIARAKQKPVLCLSTGFKYESLLEAAKVTGISFSCISRVCLGKRPHTRNLVFKYV